MPHQLPLERLTEVLFDLLDETFENVHGIYLDKGTSLCETLADITAEEASRATSGRCATLAAQVNHARYYLDVLDGYMRQALSERPDWQGSWQVGVVTAGEWARIQAELRASYEQVMATIRGFEAWDGENELPGALAVVVHTAHHLGEIRQMLCAIRA